jgi:hypothetical protein
MAPKDALNNSLKQMKEFTARAPAGNSGSQARIFATPFRCSVRLNEMELPKGVVFAMKTMIGQETNDPMNQITFPAPPCPKDK